ncbi:thermonuclease family protein [Stutzerimonas stutzeri]|uniref:thermonuclease family protein n=1 Tax=Stutzerimonas stutzeri TaxID=316 RepID=UPI001C2E0700|nr:thermonuclease family protein [Stutzerimonas stutzeri]
MRFSVQMKKASLVGAFFVSIFLTFQAQALCPASGSLARAQVARVVDGDTLRLVDGRSVRLIGLNAPEMGRKGIGAEPFAEAAKRRLQALVSANGGYVRLRTGQQAKDHYGRLLAHVYDEQGDNFEARLLAEGLGFFVAIAPNTDLADCHFAAEQQARAANRALWRRSPVIPAGELRHGGFALIRGQVERVQVNRGGIWLELADSVVLHIPHASASAFASALDNLPGRAVEARGWVIDRKGRADLSRQARWLLKLTAPSMLIVQP